MNPRALPKKLITACKDLPWILALRKRRWDRRFAARRVGSCFKGIYADFASALADAPPSWEIGYDHSGPAKMYSERMGRVYATDYPVLFWLNRILEPGMGVFDFGGHVGLLFYGYRPYLPVMEQATWKVCDVPAVVTEGRALARNKACSNLSFTSETKDAEGCDVLLASGSLQYVEKHLAEILSELATKPKHVIVNLLPTHEHHEYVTLNNIGTAICPYQVYHHQRFIERITTEGYSLKDEWENLGKECIVPFYDDHTASPYHGMYFVAS